MDRRIIYQDGFGGVAVVIPAAMCGLTVERIAQKDVPEGAVFWIVDASEIPADRTFRNAWELDTESLGEPDGVGDPIAFSAWLEEQQALRESELSGSSGEGGLNGSLDA